MYVVLRVVKKRVFFVLFLNIVLLRKKLQKGDVQMNGDVSDVVCGCGLVELQCLKNKNLKKHHTVKETQTKPKGYMALTYEMFKCIKDT